MKTFMELYLTGQISKDKVDDWIGEWHDVKTSLSLPEWLGMTEEMYEQFVVYPKEFFERYYPEALSYD